MKVSAFSKEMPALVTFSVALSIEKGNAIRSKLE